LGSERLVELDQEDKGLAIMARSTLPYSVHVIHHAAARAHRAEIVAHVAR